MLELRPSIAHHEDQPEGLILVCMVGANPLLTNGCRVNLEQLCPGAYHLLECGPSDVPSGCDIYIWDFESCPSLPDVMAMTEGAIKIVVVDKSSLASLRRKLASGDFTYLRNPVTPLALRAVLESAIARLELRTDDGDGLSRLKLDRDRILQQLLQTNWKLREQDQERTNFLARSVHDIRVPLMAVQGYCGLLLDGQLGSFDPEQTRIFEKMQRSLARLGSLVEAMLDLGTGSQAANKPRLEHASIESSVQQAVHEVLPFAERKQITLSVEVEAPNGALLFDSGQLERVLVNLLDNACKFTPSGGSITVRGRSIPAPAPGKIGLFEATPAYRIDIDDTGRGMTPEQLERIFDEHTSFGNSLDRSGSGLGLAICRMIVQAHNGRIWAESGAQGSSFSFVLPLVRSFNNSHLSQKAV